MTERNVALSRSDMFDHNPTSHSFTYVSKHKLLLLFISYVKHPLWKNNTFSKAIVSRTHLKCRHDFFTQLSTTTQQLSVQHLPTAQNEFQRSQSISEI
jgi:hypothetical protein